MTLDELTRRFAIGSQVRFREIADGVIVAHVANQHALATIALQGAHVASFQPRGEEPVFWLSPHATFARGTHLLGGVPICWPWFGPHATDRTWPVHGFARTVPWQVLETATRPDGATVLRFGLVESGATRAQWPHPSSAQLEVTVGAALRVELVTANTGEQPFTLGEALHAYFRISDVGNVTIRGLEGCEYLDKVRGLARFTQHGSVVIGSEVDRVYVNTEAECVIEDTGWKRAIRIAKEGSRSTVVWNPWCDHVGGVGDFGTDGHRGTVCVESANALPNVITLAPGDTHRLAATYSVARL